MDSTENCNHARGPTTLVAAGGVVQQTTLVGDDGEPLSEHHGSDDEAAPDRVARRAAPKVYSAPWLSSSTTVPDSIFRPRSEWRR
jgi:hypothetical protein